MNARDELDEVRRAWRMKLAAEAKLAHLRSYRRMNAGMRYDQRRASQDLSEANATLQRILGGLPPHERNADERQA